MKKRILTLLLTCIMVISILSVTAMVASKTNCANGDSCTQHEAAIGTTHYDTIGEGIDAANSSGSGTITVTVLRDAG